MDEHDLICELYGRGLGLTNRAAATIERLQREIAEASKMIASMQAQRNQAAREREEQWRARVKAERERDEVTAELGRVQNRFLDQLAEARAELEEFKRKASDAVLRAALGGEG